MTQTQPSVDRTRTYTWADPLAWLGSLSWRSGLEVLTDMADGVLPAPPVVHTLGLHDFTVVEGTVTVSLDPAEFHYNPIGSVHGGVLSTLLDTAAGCAVHSTLPAGFGYTTLDLSVRFVRPVRMDTGVVMARGRVVHRGSRTALAEADLSDAGGRLLATATSTCLLFPLSAEDA